MGELPSAPWNFYCVGADSRVFAERSIECRSINLVGTPMIKNFKRNLIVSLTLCAGALAQAAHAYEFPGQGDRQTWSQACEISNLSGQLFQAGRHDEAFTGFYKSIELYPYDAVLFYNVGLAHQQYAYIGNQPGAKSEHLKKAAEYFQKASTLKADAPDVWIHLANVQAELGQLPDSLKNLETALRLPLSPEYRQQTLAAIGNIKSRMGSSTSSGSSNTSSGSSNTSAGSSSTSSTTSSSSSTTTTSGNTTTTVNNNVNNTVKTTIQTNNWQTHNENNVSLSMPAGWRVTTDKATGQVDLTDAGGSKLTVLPFFVPKKIEPSSAPTIFKTFIKVLAPQQQWSEPQSVGQRGWRSTYSDANETGLAAILFEPSEQGTSGRAVVAKVPKRQASAVGSEMLARMISSMQFKGTTGGATTESAGAANEASESTAPAANEASESPGATTSADSSASDSTDAAPAQTEMAQGNDGDGEGGDEALGDVQPIAALPQHAQAPAQSTSSGLPPTPFNGYTTFTDPDQNSFTVEVPRGWSVQGGMTRPRPIDARPWVKVTSPDGLITAFIGDGKIPPYTMPNAQSTMLGFGPGKWYQGTLVAGYIPARTFIEKYGRQNLRALFTNVQLVDQQNLPDVARAVNGTVGASRSEAASVKFTAMYKDLPAVAYYLGVTKATVGYGTGMWWVTKIAGEVSPADRDAFGLSVIMHMLQSFRVNPAWQSAAVQTAGQVSRDYTAASQAKSQAITNNYWAQQAANENIHAGYWNRQAAQDRAAQGFSNYIRGKEDVVDPSTGTKYQVEYGPRYHWIDNSGNYAGTDYSAPGPEWRQLMSAP